MKFWFAALLGSAAVISLLADSFSMQVAAIGVQQPNTDVKNPLEGNPEAIEKGRQIYSNTCLFCHGAEGIGARAPNLVEGLFRPNGGADDWIVYDIVIKGRPGTLMGGYEGTLTEEQLWQVISYLRSEGVRRASGKK